MHDVASKRRLVWVVVKAWRGIPDAVDIFDTYGEAVHCEMLLSQTMKDEDEVRIFESKISHG